MANRKTQPIDGLGRKASSAQPVKTVSRPTKQQRQAAVVAANHPKKASKPAEPKPAKPTLTNPVAPSTTEPSTPQNKPAKKSNKVVWIVLGVIVIVAVTIGVYLLLSSAA